MIENTKKTDIKKKEYTKKIKTDAKKTDVKKIKCYGCGKEINEDETISYTISSCCGIDEIKVCKECSEKLIKGENEKCGCECDSCR
ncbi:MAG: hypothetical protein QMD06_02620 [Candidatus Altarchaeum sp.]|nr:hypothetical protein [Candidatus Altarchaeum sp.]